MKLIKLKLFVILLVIQFVTGCGGGSSDTTVTNTNTNNGIDGYNLCSLTTTLSGAVQQSINWDCRQGIGVGSKSDGFVVTYGGLDAHTLFTIDVGAIAANQIVDNRMASITILSKQDNKKWKTALNACVVNISINSTNKNELGGTGTCQGNQANPVEGTGATGTVTIGDFTFLALNPL